MWLPARRIGQGHQSQKNLHNAALLGVCWCCVFMCMSLRETEGDDIVYAFSFTLMGVGPRSIWLQKLVFVLSEDCVHNVRGKPCHTWRMFFFLFPPSHWTFYMANLFHLQPDKNSCCTNTLCIRHLALFSHLIKFFSCQVRTSCLCQCLHKSFVFCLKIHFAMLSEPPNIKSPEVLLYRMLSHVDMALCSQPSAWLMLFCGGQMKSHSAVNAEDRHVTVSYIYHTKDKNRT